ncbi:MAG: class I SAM-dependent methyltransferase, partial [Flavobacteriales bacterium]|nr:class I SAM-dependent methyltransferase [Flavobacteriales bacterium]
MDTMQAIAGTDIYLLDQLMKKNIHPGQRILDAGCGMGSNITWLLNRGAEVWGIDISEDDIKYLQKTFPHAKDHFIQSTIESFSAPVKFDVVICSAVLHFARSHDHFEDMFGQLVSFLKPGGVLFIRMASNIGMER